MNAGTRIVMIAAIVLWAVSLFSAFGISNVPIIALLLISCFECAVGIAAMVRSEMNLFYAAMGLRGLANSALAILAWSGVSLAEGYSKSILFGTLAISILFTLSPRVRSITAIAVRLRRFPVWFMGTKTYRSMDRSYSILWFSVFLISAVLSLTSYRNAALNLLAIAGLACELMCFLFIRSAGYDYLAFVTGKAE